MELMSEHVLENKHLSLVNKFVGCWMLMWNISCVTDKIYLSWPGQLHQFTCFWKCIDWYLISAINSTIRFKIYLLAHNKRILRAVLLGQIFTPECGSRLWKWTAGAKGKALIIWAISA